MLDCTCTRNWVRQNFATIPMWGLRAKGEPSNSGSLSAFFMRGQADCGGDTSQEYVDQQKKFMGRSGEAQAQRVSLVDRRL